MQGLRVLGYIEGKNLVLEWRSAEGKYERLPDIIRELGINLLFAEHTPTDYTNAFAHIERERIDALLVPSTGANFANRHSIVEFAEKSRLPAMYQRREFVDAGGLIAYGVGVADLFRGLAGYIDRIFKGAKPADLPVEQPTKFELVINLKTAKVLGITVPPALLTRADEVIE